MSEGIDYSQEVEDRAEWCFECENYIEDCVCKEMIRMDNERKVKHE